jgi:hypothetical protein
LQGNELRAIVFGGGRTAQNTKTQNRGDGFHAVDCTTMGQKPYLVILSP